MSTATLQMWDTLNAEATGRLQCLAGHVRAWAAATYAMATSGTPGHVVAALDATSRPTRTRLVARDDTATDRDRATAAADDLWDAVAVVWCMVRRTPRDDAPDVEHVVAELHAAGRWLAKFPVHVHRHEKALAELFAG